MSNGMILHCGGKEVDFAEVELVETPEPTETHFPLAHDRFVRGVRHHLKQGGFEIKEQHHALAHEGMRYFGVITLGNVGRGGDYNWTIGMRNSHDKAFAAGIAAGSRVLVCDNLCFNGEVTVMRKHTRNISADLNNRMTLAVGQLGQTLRLNDDRYEEYKSCKLSERDVNHLMIEALDAQIIPASRIPKVLGNWREPQQEEFQEHRNVWGLFNAFTEDFKRIQDPNAMLRRGQALHGMMDTVVGFDVTRN